MPCQLWESLNSKNNYWSKNRRRNTDLIRSQRNFDQVCRTLISILKNSKTKIKLISTGNNLVKSNQGKNLNGWKLPNVDRFNFNHIPFWDFELVRKTYVDCFFNKKVKEIVAQLDLIFSIQQTGMASIWERGRINIYKKFRIMTWRVSSCTI